MNFLEKAENLKTELDVLRPVDSEIEARIMQKFRLDWNYHSNNLEGNSLTYSETKAVVLFGITAHGKLLKDHLEIAGHNEAVNWIFESAKNADSLTEELIFKLHAHLIKESNYKQTNTSEGDAVRSSIGISRYKTQPNHISTVTGETFYFATPEETPAKMRELIEWFEKEKKKPDANPIILAAVFHYRFIRIHPFDTGNGRIARILMNFVLMQFGYPPVIVKTEDKENYLAVLRLADVGELQPFSDYITQNLIHSLKVMIRGAKGEAIEEPNDFDKELELLKEKAKNVGKTVEISKNREILLEVFENSIKPLIERFIEVCQKFDDFYIKTQLLLLWGGVAASIPKSEAVANVKSKILDKDNFQNTSLDYNFINFRQTGFDDFNFSSRINFRFELARYKIILGEINPGEVNHGHNGYGQFGYAQFGYGDIRSESNVADDDSFEVCEKLYSERISSEEIEEIVKIIAGLHKEFIEGEIEEKIDAKNKADEFIDWS